MIETPTDGWPHPPGPAPQARARRLITAPSARAAVVTAGLVALTLVAYGSVIRHGGFVWDDDILLTNNPVIPRLDGLRIFWWPPQDDPTLARAVSDYWPITWTTLWLEWRLWEGHPTGYHVTNILLHALAAVLLWRLLKALGIPGAVLAAAIFAVHPVCVTSVAWISERKNTLSMVFYLLTLLAYARFDTQRRKRWYLLAALAFIAAMLSKTQVITAPLVLLGIAWWRRRRIARRDVLAAVPLLILSAIFAAVTLWFHRQHALGLVPARPEGFGSRLAAAGMIPWFYLYKALVPLKLTMAYPRWNVDPANPLSYVPGVLLLATLAGCWVLRKTALRPLLAALGYFVIVLFPVLGFFEMSFARISLVSDHLQYHALLGPIVLVAAVAWRGIARLRGRWHAAAVVAVLLLLAVLTALTYVRGLTFRSSRTLWADVLTKNPKCPEAHYETAMHLTDDADDRRAAGAHQEAAALLQQALEHYQQAIRLRPEYSEAHNNLGQLYYVRLHNLPRAGYHFARAVQIRPDNHIARSNLAMAQYGIGATEEAAGNFRRVLAALPDHVPALFTLARILASDPNPRLRNGQEAVILAQKACQLSPPDDPLGIECIDTLAMAYAEVGQFDAAITTGLRATQLARQRGQAALADAILARVASYRQGQPSRVTAAPPPVPTAPATQASTAPATTD